MNDGTYSFDTEVIIQRIEYLIEKSGKTKAQVFRESGVSRSIIDNLKKGSLPTVDKLVKLSMYFGVPIEFFVGIPSTVADTSEDLKKQLDSIYNDMPYEKRMQVIEYAKFLLSKQENGE